MPNIDVTIIRSNRKTLSMELKSPTELVVRAPYTASKRSIEQFLREKRSWIETHATRMARTQAAAKTVIAPITTEELALMKKQAKAYIPSRVAFYAKEIGVSYGQISFRAQKTRFGSCSAKGNLNFNIILMKMPSSVIDYVVVHELCHRKQMNHSAAFWAEVEKVLPGYRKERAWLKQYGRYYIDALAGVR